MPNIITDAEMAALEAKQKPGPGFVSDADMAKMEAQEKIQNAPSLLSAIEPRTIEAQQQGKGLVEQLPSTALDLASLPGRAISGIGDGVTEALPTWLGGNGGSLSDAYAAAKQAAANTGADQNSPGYQKVFENVLKDPATLATLAVGGPEVGMAAKGLGGFADAALAGLRQGAVSGLTHQAENLDQGQDINPLQLGAETVGSGLAGVGGKVTGDIVSNLGKSVSAAGAQTVNAILRPGRAGANDGYKTSTMFKNNLIANTLPEMDEKTQSVLSDLNNQLDQIRQAGADKGVKVDGNNIYMDAIDNMAAHDNEFDMNKIGAIMENEIAPVIKKYQNPDGSIYLVDAMKLKTMAGEKGAWAAKGAGRVADDATATAAAYNSVYDALKNTCNDAIKTNELGDIEKINQQFTDIIPVARVIQRRLPIATSNNVLSLPDIAMGGAGLIAGAGSGDQDLPRWARGALGAAAMAGLSRVSRSPAVGEGAYNLGNAIQQPLQNIAQSPVTQAASQLGTQAIRSNAVPPPQNTKAPKQFTPRVLPDPLSIIGGP